MPSPRGFRRHRLLVSVSLALVFLAGCLGPTAPAVTGKRGSGGSDRRASADGGSGDDGSTQPQVAAAGAASAQGGAAQAIDNQKFLLGRVFVPVGIVSNNGANVIGQNGASVIGQNGASIVSNNGGSVIGQNGANVIGQNGASVIGQNGANVIGQNGASVIGQNGANVIGQNGASVIGQNGAAIVSNNGGSVIGQNGAGIISNNGGSLGQRPLAFAMLKVVDAAGKPKLGKNGQPLEGRADAWGQFLIPREEIDANSVIKVSSPIVNGELAAFLPKGAQTPDQELEVDMVSTLSTTYILETYVAGKQGILERLTPEIEAEARQDVKKAIESKVDGLIETTDTREVVAALERLIGKDSGVQDVFDRIETLLIVVGIQNDGDGLPARSVPLDEVRGVLATADGVYIFTPGDHRLRFVGADGLLRNVVKENGWPYPEVKPGNGAKEFVGMAFHDGWLYLPDSECHRVVRIKNRTVEVLAGNGAEGNSPAGTIATEASISFPNGVVVGPDGLVYFTDTGNKLVRRITAKGALETVVGGGDVSTYTSPVDPRAIRLSGPRGLAFDGVGDLVFADDGPVRKLATATGLIVPFIGQGTVSSPRAVAFDRGELYLGSSSSIHHVKENFETENVSPLVAGVAVSNWLRANRGMAFFEGKAYVQQSNGILVELDLGPARTIREIAGVEAAGDSETLLDAWRMDINTNGDLVVADRGAKVIYVKRIGAPLTAVAGNGEDGYVETSLKPLEVPVDRLADVRWDGPDAFVFSTIGTRPCVVRVEIGGSYQVIAGNGAKDGGLNGAYPPGLAVEVSLDQPSSILRLPDRRLLIMDNGVPYVLGSDGLLETFTNWPEFPTIQDPADLSLASEQFVMADLRSGNVIAVKDGDMEVLATSAEIAALIGAGEIRSVVLDGEDRLYVASSSQIVQKDLRTGKMRIFAGLGGVVLNESSRDTSLLKVRDLVISLQGDLFILEYDQVKQIAKAKLTIPL